MTDASVSRPQRSAALIFTQSTLVLQALAASFAVLALFGLGKAGVIDVSGWIVWGAGPVLVVLLAYAAGQQKRRWGRWLGWVLQAPMIVAGVLVPEIAIIGVMFLAIWILGVRLGTRIDRERAEREAADSQGDQA